MSGNIISYSTAKHHPVGEKEHNITGNMIIVVIAAKHHPKLGLIVVLGNNNIHSDQTSFYRVSSPF